MMFVDASAMVAIIAKEPEYSALSVALAVGLSSTSPLAVYEASLGVARSLKLHPEAARDEVRKLLALFDVDILPITDADSDAALDAFARYGKGRHPAKLNMGDCFAYAMAKNRDLAILYKGDDFALTDVRSAV